MQGDNARATVIVPTFGNALFARWAIKSVQQQTVKDLEICVICDGSPPEMVSYFEGLASEDHRIQVFAFPKAPRTGEQYRDIVIRKTSGRIICYCCHDDLWLPHHVRAMEKALQKSCFAHSIHARINVPEVAGINRILLGDVLWVNVGPEIIKKMQGGENYFGLTFGAHTRNSYYQLKEGWVTTPIPYMPTDLYMWNKFLAAFGERSHTLMRITALNFRKMDRLCLGWSEQQRDEELKGYFEKLNSPQFLRQIYRESARSCPTPYKKRYFLNSLGLWFPPDLRIVEEWAEILKKDKLKVFSSPLLEAGKLSLVGGATLFSVDRINGRLLNQQTFRVAINAQSEKKITISGWAVDQMAGTLSGGVFINIDGLKDIPAIYGLDRLDVADHFKNNKYRFSGFSVSFATSILGKGQHSLSLKIVTADNKGFYEPDQRITIERK